ncbi:QueT transporter family protein [bacterium]|nr:QueT transporter family protein [bacterium]
MKQTFSMWRNTRMIVLTSISAALYVAVLMPFKIIPLIPGLTELRPGAALPVTLSFMFGPAAAWGAGLGNLIADIFGGMLGPGSFFGFWGNFLYGFIPFALFQALSTKENPLPCRLRDWALLVLIIITAASGIGLFIGWGLDLLKLAPFSALGNIISINNLIASLLFALVLLILIYPRVAQWGLTYQEIMADAPRPKPWLRKTGAVIMIASCLGGLMVGNLLSIGYLDSGFLSAGFSEGTTGSLAVGLGLTPFIIGILIAFTLL